MLEIRQDQIDSLSGQRVEPFVYQMMDRLHEHFTPELQSLQLDENGLEWLVRRGIAQAEMYDISLLDLVEVFIEGMVVFSPDYDTSSNFVWAGKILRRYDLDADEKMDLINNHILFGHEILV